jgi:transcriptional regulator with XRE-family HTH domain
MTNIKGFATRDNEQAHEYAIALGQRLFKIRTQNKLSQLQMGQSLDLCGMTYSRYEKGDRIPDASICAAIVQKYGVDPHWLLCGDLKK